MCGLVQTEAQDTIITVMGLYKTNEKKMEMIWKIIRNYYYK